MCDGRRELYRRRGGDDGGNPADQAVVAGGTDHPGDFQRVVWIAGRRTRGGELGFSVLLHEGGSGPGDREYRKARALCVHSVR